VIARNAGAVALLLLSAPALADDSHYQNFLAGERAAGMGGAYTAIAHDPSGTWYNPAGLVDINYSTLSASLNFYGLQQASLGTAFGPNGGDLFNRVGAVVSQISAVPGLAGSINGIGEPRSDGTYKQAWALSVMVLDDTAASTTSYGVDTSGQLKSLSQTLIDFTTWIGFGYGYRLNDDVSVGISANAFYRNYTSRQRTINANPASPGGTSAQQFALNDISLSLSVVGIALEFGVLWVALPRLSLGAALSTPTLKIYGGGNTDQVQSAGNASGSGLTEVNLQGLTADTVFPVHLRLGAAYRYNSSSVIALDLSMWAPVSYQLVSGSPVSGAQLQNFVNDVRRNFTVNVDVGAQWKISNWYPLRTGFFTNFASSPQVDSGPQPQLSHVNLYGVTFGFTLPSKHTETTLGILFSYGEGSTKGPKTIAPNGDIVYQKEFSSLLLLNFYVGGSFSF
jgi:hypothetical protein